MFCGAVVLLCFQVVASRSAEESLLVLMIRVWLSGSLQLLLAVLQRFLALLAVPLDSWGLLAFLGLALVLRVLWELAVLLGVALLHGFF